LHLERTNEEYSTKCDGGRLLPVRVREVPAGTWNALRDERTNERGNFEEYKHPCLVGDLHFVDRLSTLRPLSPSTTAPV
jgi:GH3 auxin-responsive promoter